MKLSEHMLNESKLRGRPLIHNCAIWGHKKVVKYLIDNGADVDAKDTYHWTALMWASKYGEIEIAKMLIDAGADVNNKGSDMRITMQRNRTALSTKKEEKEKIIEFLKKKMYGDSVSESIEDFDRYFKIDDKVFGGDLPLDDTIPKLRKKGVTLIIDFIEKEERKDIVKDKKPDAYDVDKSEKLGMDYMNIQIENDDLPGKKQIWNFISAIEKNKGKVFIHCHAGKGRTGIMGVIWLMHKHKMTIDQAYKKIISVDKKAVDELPEKIRMFKKKGMEKWI